MYFKEFSCNPAENMQARCVPRFIQRVPRFAAFVGVGEESGIEKAAKCAEKALLAVMYPPREGSSRRRARGFWFLANIPSKAKRRSRWDSASPANRRG